MQAIIPSLLTTKLEIHVSDVFVSCAFYEQQFTMMTLYACHMCATYKTIQTLLNTALCLLQQSISVVILRDSFVCLLSSPA